MARREPDLLEIMAVLEAATSAVDEALLGLEDWGPSGLRAGQYQADLVADEAAVSVLGSAGLGVLSEESGLLEAQRPLLAVLDPLDGSTNASLHLPWYATSVCVLDARGPLLARVVNLASGVAFEAVRGGGATRDKVPISPSRCARLDDAVVGMSGYPPGPFGSAQVRSLGAIALDLCAVASGMLDAYVDWGHEAHGSWDYLGGMLVCQEAGALVIDAWSRDLVVRSHHERRTPIGAGRPELVEAVVKARRALGRAATR